MTIAILTGTVLAILAPSGQKSYKGVRQIARLPRRMADGQGYRMWDFIH